MNRYKSLKSRDVDMKFNPRKNSLDNKKQKIVFAILIKLFYSQVMNIFGEALNKKLWGKSLCSQ